MKCNQCDRPAFYQFGDAGLCIDCEHKRVSIHGIQFLQAAALMNQSLDDLDAVSGFHTPGGRIPLNAIANAIRGKTTLNNITVTNSTIGAINTGDLARIDAVITLAKGTDADDVGRLVQQLTQAVLDAKELVPAAKKELLDLIQSLAEQAVGSQGQSKASVAKALLESVEKKVSSLSGLAEIVRNLAVALSKLFGS